MLQRRAQICARLGDEKQMHFDTLKPDTVDHPYMPALLATGLHAPTLPPNSRLEAWSAWITRPLALDTQRPLALYAQEIEVIVKLRGFIDRLPAHFFWRDVLDQSLNQAEFSWPPARSQVRDCIDLCRLVKRFFASAQAKMLPSERVCLAWLRHLYPEAPYPAQSPPL